MSNTRPVVAERRVVQRQQDRWFAGINWTTLIQGIKHPALNIAIAILPIVIPLLLAQHVLVVVVVFAPSSTAPLLSSAVEECALLVEVLLNVRLQFFRQISHRCNLLFVPSNWVLSLQFLFSLFFFLFSYYFLFSFFFCFLFSFFFCFLFSQNFLFSLFFFFQSELI